MKITYTGDPVDMRDHGDLLPGEEYDLPRKIAQELINRGVAEPASHAKAAKETAEAK